MFNKLALHRPERGFPLLRENLRHRLALEALDFVIAIHELEFHLTRHLAAHRAFPGAHETDEVEVDIHATDASEQRTRDRRKIASRPPKGRAFPPRPEQAPAQLPLLGSARRQIAGLRRITQVEAASI
jgi:hypothetical protein